MAYLLELVGSTIIGGLVILMILQLNSSILDSSTTFSMEKLSQTNLTSLAEEIEYDLRKIGFKVTTGDKIINAGTNTISYRCDIDNNGIIDTVAYVLSDTLALTVTPNPRDRLLYRTVNGSPSNLTSNLGVTNFQLWYYTAGGALTTTASQVRSVKFALSIEGVYPFRRQFEDTLYVSGAYLERIIQPNNLR